MARILSIDYGRRRTGIAVTDPLQIIAGGLATVSTSDLMTWLDNYLAAEDVQMMVVGLPMQTNGKPSENLQRIKAFVKDFSNKHPEVPVQWVDERFTSVLAHRAMIEGGLKKKDRQNKALVDEVSATIILQGYLESRRK